MSDPKLLENARKSRFLLFETLHLECHQQRSFTLKMHQNRWWLGLRPDPTGEAPSWIREPTSKERARGEKGGIGRGGKEGEGGARRGGDFQNWTLTMLETD